MLASGTLLGGSSQPREDPESAPWEGVCGFYSRHGEGYMAGEQRGGPVKLEATNASFDQGGSCAASLVLF